MIRISAARGQIAIDAKGADLAPRHESQLAYWGFIRDEASGHLLGSSQDSQGLIAKVVVYFNLHGVEHSVDDHIARLLEARRMLNQRWRLPAKRASNSRTALLISRHIRNSRTFFEQA